MSEAQKLRRADQSLRKPKRTVSAEFVRDHVLPAVRANASLRTLSIDVYFSIQTKQWRRRYASSLQQGKDCHLNAWTRDTA